ncbi:Coiled-coil protein [Giardia lamblia P15]|uniref:Coiled-coil protein n=1 Tax=Giardia intestinalis (strain P15) TaxID=658858 RepID=E1EW34_GIAIA|nr:Coiled-coil protein [Giardia lamblia P15]
MSNSGTYPLFGSVARSASHSKVLTGGNGSVMRPSRSSSSSGAVGRSGGTPHSAGFNRHPGSQTLSVGPVSGEPKQAAGSARIHRPMSAGINLKVSDLLTGAFNSTTTAQSLRPSQQTTEDIRPGFSSAQLLSTHSALEKKFHQLEQLHSQLQTINDDILMGIQNSTAQSSEYPEPARCTDPQDPPAAAVQISHIYDVLSTIKTTNEAIKTDFQRELEALSQQLQTSLAENGELLRENLMLKDIISQKELHISDLTHFAKTKEKEVDRLSELLATAERINSAKNIELKSYLDECATVSKHNESVIAERSNELQILRSTNEQLSLTLSVAQQELDNAKGELSKIQASEAALHAERDELERRLKKVKANAEKFITQRDTEIARLKDELQQLEQEKKSVKQDLRLTADALSSYKAEAAELQILIAQLGVSVSSVLSSQQEETIPLASGVDVSAQSSCPALRELVKAIVEKKDTEIRGLQEELANYRTADPTNSNVVGTSLDVLPHISMQRDDLLEPREKSGYTPPSVVDKGVLAEYFCKDASTLCLIDSESSSQGHASSIPTSLRDLPDGPLAQEIRREIHGLQANVAACETQIAALLEERNKMQASAESFAGEILSLTQKIDTLKHELARSEQTIVELRQTDKTVELAVLQAKYDVLSDTKLDPTVLLNKYMEGEKKAEELRGKIYEALSRETELQREKSELQASLSVARAEYDILVRKLADLEHVLAAAKASAASASDVHSRLVATEAELARANSTISVHEKTIETLTLTCKDLEVKLANAEDALTENIESLNATLRSQKQQHSQQIEEKDNEIVKCKERILQLTNSGSVPGGQPSSTGNSDNLLHMESALNAARLTEDNLKQQLHTLRETMTMELSSKISEIESLKKELSEAAAKQAELSAQLEARSADYLVAKKAAQKNETLEAKLRALETELKARPTFEYVSDLKHKLDAASSAADMLRTEVSACKQERSQLDAALQEKTDSYVLLQSFANSLKEELHSTENARMLSEKALNAEIESLKIAIEEKAVLLAQLTSKLSTYEDEKSRLQVLLDEKAREADQSARKLCELEALLEEQRSTDQSQTTKLAMLSDQLAHMDEEKRNLVGILTATHKEVQLKALEEKATYEHATAIKERLHEANQEITALQDQLRIAEHKLSHKSLAESAEVLKLRDEIALLTHRHRQELEEREDHWRMQLLSQREQFSNATAASLQQELDAATKTLDRVILTKNAEIQALKRQLGTVRDTSERTDSLSEREVYESTIKDLRRQIEQLKQQFHKKDPLSRARSDRGCNYADALEKSISPRFTISARSQRPGLIAPEIFGAEIKNIDDQITFKPELTSSSVQEMEMPTQGASSNEKVAADNQRLTVQELLDRSRELNAQVGTLSIDMNYFHEKLDKSLDLTASTALRPPGTHTSMLQTKDLQESDLDASVHNERQKPVNPNGTCMS